MRLKRKMCKVYKPNEGEDEDVDFGVLISKFLLLIFYFIL